MSRPAPKNQSGYPAMFFDASPRRAALDDYDATANPVPTAPSVARRRRLPRTDIVVDGDAMAAIGRRRRWRRRSWSRTSPSRLAIPVETEAPRSAGGVGGRARSSSRRRLRAWRSRSDRGSAIGRRHWWQGRSWSRTSPSRMAIPVGPRAPRHLSRPITPRGLPRRRRPDRPQPSRPPGGPPGVGTDSHGRTDHPNPRLKDRR